MGTLFIVLCIAIPLIIIAVTGKEPSDGRIQIQGSSARITLAEAAQINRVTTLALLDAPLARALADELEGDAWQHTQSTLCYSLLDEGDQEAALHLLARLDEHHQGEALLNVMIHLVDTGKEQQALDLLEATGAELPADSLPHIALLHASGRLDEASAALDEREQAIDRLEPQQLFWLARDQRRLARQAAASRTLDRLWETLRDDNAPHRYLLPDLLRELGELGEFQRLQDIGAQVPAAPRAAAIGALIHAGRFEQARTLFDSLEPYQQSPYHQQIFNTLLERGQLAQALEWLPTVDDYLHTDLLLRLAQWHIEQGTFASLEESLPALSRNPHERIDCYLSLCAVEAVRHPELAPRLLDQVEHWLSELPDDEQQVQLRFLTLDARLTLQSRLPERERVSYEVRRNLEQMERLLPRLSTYHRIANLERLAGLLQALGRIHDAPHKLEQARELVRQSTQEELEDLDKALLLGSIASRYLQFGRLDLALATRADIPATEADCDEHEWIGALIDHGHLEQAIGAMRFAHLHEEDKPLTSLRTRIDAMAEAGQATRAQLLDRLRSDAFWAAAA